MASYRHGPRELAFCVVQIGILGQERPQPRKGRSIVEACDKPVCLMMNYATQG